MERVSSYSLSAAYRAIYQERQAGSIHLVYVEEVNKHDY